MTANEHTIQPNTLRTIERHVTSHGFKCVISKGRMIICIPRYNAACSHVGHQLVRVTNLRDAYIAMGY